jgi:hypothetical protein
MGDSFYEMAREQLETAQRLLPQDKDTKVWLGFLQKEKAGLKVKRK